MLPKMAGHIARRETFLFENLKERDHSDDLGADGKILS